MSQFMNGQSLAALYDNRTPNEIQARSMSHAASSHAITSRLIGKDQRMGAGGLQNFPFAKPATALSGSRQARIQKKISNQMKLQINPSKHQTQAGSIPAINVQQFLSTQRKGVDTSAQKLAFNLSARETSRGSADRYDRSADKHSLLDNKSLLSETKKPVGDYLPDSKQYSRHPNPLKQKQAGIMTRPDKKARGLDKLSFKDGIEAYTNHAFTVNASGNFERSKPQKIDSYERTRLLTNPSSESITGLPIAAQTHRNINALVIEDQQRAHTASKHNSARMNRSTQRSRQADTSKDKFGGLSEYKFNKTEAGLDYTMSVSDMVKMSFQGRHENKSALNYHPVTQHKEKVHVWSNEGSKTCFLDDIMKAERKKIGPQNYAKHNNWASSLSNTVTHGVVSKGKLHRRERPLVSQEIIDRTKKANVPPPGHYEASQDRKPLLGRSSKAEKRADFLDDAVSHALTMPSYKYNHQEAFYKQSTQPRVFALKIKEPKETSPANAYQIIKSKRPDMGSYQKDGIDKLVRPKSFALIMSKNPKTPFYTTEINRSKGRPNAATYRVDPKVFNRISKSPPSIRTRRH